VPGQTHFHRFGAHALKHGDVFCKVALQSKNSNGRHSYQLVTSTWLATLIS
jgi:hypothetical protein